MFKQLKKRAKAMEKTLSSLNETLIAANKTASVSTRFVCEGLFLIIYPLLHLRHTQGTSDLTLVDATFTSTQCGAFVRHLPTSILYNAGPFLDPDQLEHHPELLPRHWCLHHTNIHSLQWRNLHSGAGWLVPRLLLQ